MAKAAAAAAKTVAPPATVRPSAPPKVVHPNLLNKPPRPFPIPPANLVLLENTDDN